MADNWDQFARASDDWDQFQPVEAPAKAAKKGGIGQMAGDALAGLVRGAGSIGATLVAPYDIAKDALAGKGLSLESNRERRASMDAGLETMGADPESVTYQVGKVGGEIAGTAGLGPVIAGGLRATPLVAKAPNLLEAISTAGMRAGGATGASNLLARSAGGAITGGAAAGAVDPEFALTGGAIGGALPGALKVAGYGGNALRGMVSGPAQTPELAQAIQAARGAGYVIPPSQARPSLLNRTMEGFAGKITTAQNTSAKNQPVTQKLVARSLGLPEETAITLDALKAVRASAGQTYQNVRGSGVVAADSAFDQAVADIAAKYKTTVPSFPGLGKTGMHGNPVDDIADLVGALKTRSFDSSEAVDAIGILREKADKAFLTGDKTLGKASKDAANALEDLVGRHLAANGTPEMLSTFQQARQLIAKTYSVEKAMNVSTGTIDARKLASQLQRGKPLSGELKQAAEFAGRFPKAAQVTEAMGSLPQTSPLDWALGGGLSAATMNPALMASVLARPAVRGLITSPLVQNRLVQGQPNALAALLANSGAGQIGYRSAPILGSGQ